MSKWWVVMPGWWWNTLGFVLGTGLSGEYDDMTNTIRSVCRTEESPVTSARDIGQLRTQSELDCDLRPDLHDGQWAGHAINGYGTSASGTKQTFSMR